MHDIAPCPVFVPMEMDDDAVRRVAVYYEEREEMAMHILESIRDAFPLDAVEA